MQPSKIRDQRKQLGLSQVRLAREAEVSRFRYVLWEIGDGDLTPDELRSVEQAVARIAEAEMVRLKGLIQEREQAASV